MNISIFFVYCLPWSVKIICSVNIDYCTYFIKSTRNILILCTFKLFFNKYKVLHNIEYFVKHAFYNRVRRFISRYLGVLRDRFLPRPIWIACAVINFAPLSSWLASDDKHCCCCPRRSQVMCVIFTHVLTHVTLLWMNQPSGRLQAVFKHDRNFNGLKND